ncbi:LamG domain-containing protein [Candidatus Marithrix sp. Canyon 246]|uniref:LamG domain-containing protein n=1 Tax=Candidatus Marithrix sp. Canyon 246 TaxID=1827136 RepID=UPI00084A25AB|nr:LamG domain-containing protein [Candidatus Marithrix sp. Canyon 246]
MNKSKFLTAMVLFAALSSNVLAGLNDGLVAYYPFDGNARDESGNDTQIHLNTSIYYVNGKIAQGITSTKNYNVEQISVSKPFKQEFFTISYWNNAIINHNKTYGDTNISVWHSTKPNQRSFIFTTSSGNHSAYHQHEYPEINVSDNINNTGKGISLYYGENQLNERQWHHILLTYENGNIDVFVNGLPIIQNKFTYVSPVERDMLIALRGDDMLDELRIYNRALSESEIKQLYQGCQPSIDIILNSNNRVTGDKVVINSHIKAPASSDSSCQPSKVTAKIWAKLPNNSIISLIKPLTGLTLLPGDDIQTKVFEYIFRGAEPIGSYEISGRLLDQFTGDSISTDIETLIFSK